MSAPLALFNGSAFDLAAVPLVPYDELASTVAAALSGGQRLAALFGDADGDAVRVYAVLADDGAGRLGVLCARARDRIPSLAASFPQAHLFERELAEQWGLLPEGHPWLKPVRFEAPWREGPGTFRHEGKPIPGSYPFFAMEGEEVHEVAVGPVHAGVIEPGHFRFQCHGEIVFHLEIQLGYQHRGVEKMLVGGPDRRTRALVESIAGDTAVGHGVTHAAAVESLAGVETPPRALALRAVALELERLANHVGDLGALAGDVGFLPTASYCGRLRAEFLNASAELCGSRFGRGLAAPGGVRFDLDAAKARALVARVDRAWSEVEAAAALFFDAPSVRSRTDGCGTVPRATALELGMVGPAARACGIARDVRRDHAAGIYRFAHVPLVVHDSGDVFARAWIRLLEGERSVEFVRDQLKDLPGGPIRAELPPPRPGKGVVMLVEGWRGEILHAALTDERGRFRRYKVKDPSFHNWTGLAMALRGQQISDFPLNNKSFNLSYAGHDL